MHPLPRCSVADGCVWHRCLFGVSAFCASNPAATYAGGLQAQSGRLLRIGSGQLRTETFSYEGEWLEDQPHGTGTLDLFGTAVPLSLRGQWRAGSLEGRCEFAAPAEETQWHQEPRGSHLLGAVLSGECVAGYLHGEARFSVAAQQTGRERHPVVSVRWSGQLRSGLIQGKSTLTLGYQSGQEVVYDLDGVTVAKDSLRILTMHNATAFRRDEADMKQYLRDNLPDEESEQIGELAQLYTLYCRMDVCYFGDHTRAVPTGELGIADSDDEYLLQNALGSLLEFLRLARFHDPTDIPAYFAEWTSNS